MKHDLQRLRMVDNQLRANKVTNERLVDAMSSVPREAFVPPALRGVAYVDEDLQLFPGRYLLEPMVFARLVQALEISADDIVLDVACGLGYSSAVLARLAGTVVALEDDAARVGQANEVLSNCGVDNAVVVEGPLPEGYPKQQPYDAILINGAVDQVPQTLIAQLADGGRLGAVIAKPGGLGRAAIWERFGDSTAERWLFDAGTPKLEAFSREVSFTF